jgi:hypothetical protein
MEELGKLAGYDTKEDWYRLQAKDVIRHGGYGLLNHYKGSPSKLLQGVYPEHDWLLWKFEMVPIGYLKQLSKDEAQCFKLVESISQTLQIVELEDWYRVSSTQINKFVCHDIHKMLPTLYPQHKWDKERLKNRKGTMRASQRILELSVKEIFPKQGKNIKGS